MVRGSSDARIGQVIGQGQYVLRELIGRGGMGEVFRADGPNGSRAAIKFIRFDGASSDDDERTLEARFRREARIASALDSPHIARVLYAGRTQANELFIAFEYLEGMSLAARLQQADVLPVSELAWVVDDVLQGLQFAHAAGIVHRDIKPGNIFLEREPQRAKVLDFGIAKQHATAPDDGSSTRNLTSVGTMLGSESYMAPEQIDGAAAVDARADLYALGVVAFRCFTGKLPFVEAFSPLVSKKRIGALSLQDVTALVWPSETEAFFRVALQREPAKRFIDAAAMRQAWAGCVRLQHPSVSAGVGVAEPDTETR